MRLLPLPFVASLLLLCLCSTPGLAQPQDAAKQGWFPPARRAKSTAVERALVARLTQASGVALSDPRAFEAPSRQFEAEGRVQRWPAFRALRFSVEGWGAEVAILSTSSADDAERILGELLRPKTAERLVLDQRDREVVILWGAKGLANPKTTAGYLAAIWKVVRPQAKRENLVVIPPAESEVTFVAHTRRRGKIYATAANMFHQGRKTVARGETQAGGLTWAFEDPATNELRASSKAFHLHGLLTADSAVVVCMCPTIESSEAEWRYLRALTGEREFARSPKKVELETAGD